MNLQLFVTKLNPDDIIWGVIKTIDGHELAIKFGDQIFSIYKGETIEYDHADNEDVRLSFKQFVKRPSCMIELFESPHVLSFDDSMVRD